MVGRHFALVLCSFFVIGCSNGGAKDNVYANQKPFVDELGPSAKSTDHVFDWASLREFVRNNSITEKEKAPPTDPSIYDALAGLFVQFKNPSELSESYSSNLTRLAPKRFSWGNDLIDSDNYFYLDFEEGRWHLNQRVEHEFFDVKRNENGELVATRDSDSGPFVINIVGNTVKIGSQTFTRIGGPTNKLALFKEMLVRREKAERELLPGLIEPSEAKAAVRDNYKVDFNSIVSGNFANLEKDLATEDPIGFRGESRVIFLQSRSEIMERFQKVREILLYAGFVDIASSSEYFNEFRFTDMGKIASAFPGSIVVELMAGRSTMVAMIYSKKSNHWRLVGFLDYADRE